MKKFIPYLGVLLLLAGLAGRFGPPIYERWAGAPAGPLNIVVVSESSQEPRYPSSLLNWLNDPAFRKQLSDAGNTFTICDPNGRGPDLPVWALDAATVSGLPLPVWCSRAKGTVHVTIVPCPIDESAAIALAKKQGAL
jgi:hypothetical protein